MRNGYQFQYPANVLHGLILSDSTERAVAIGDFDGVHLGHVSLLKQMLNAGKQGGLSPLVLTFCENTKEKTKMAKTIQGQDEKLESLGRCGITDVLLLPFEEIRKMDCKTFVDEILLQKLHAKAVFVGENFRFGYRQAGDAELLRKLVAEGNGNCEIVPCVQYKRDTISSSRIREMLCSGMIEDANEMLGRPYSFVLEVLPGTKVGRGIGFPTINQKFPETRLIPAYGVYASEVDIGGKTYQGITDIGVKPTVGEFLPQAETHILRYSGDLYQQNIKVSLIRYLRPERKFNNTAELKEQIEKDISQLS